MQYGWRAEEKESGVPAASDVELRVGLLHENLVEPNVHWANDKLSLFIILDFVVNICKVLEKDPYSFSHPFFWELIIITDISLLTKSN